MEMEVAEWRIFTKFSWPGTVSPSTWPDRISTTTPCLAAVTTAPSGMSKSNL